MIRLRLIALFFIVASATLFANIQPAFAEDEIPTVNIACPPGQVFDGRFETCVPSAVQNTVAPKFEGTSVQSQKNGGGLDGDGTKVFGWLWGNIMNMFATLTGYAGVLLNDAVVVTVLQMGSFINNLSAVGVVWHIMRDLGNIVLIFGFIAVGVCYILGVNWYGGGTKMIPMLLISAIFINFSLFASEAVIDVGNIFASQFYTQINGGKTPQFAPIFTFGTMDSIHQEGISNVIMGSLGLQTLYDIGDGSGERKLTDTQINLIGFLGSILFIIAAFVMFSLAFILIARFVTLIFLIIIAPIGFAGLAVPKLEGYAHKWWEALIKNTISAPILLLALYVALTVITDAGFLSGFNAKSSGWTQLASSQGPAEVGSFAGILLSFLVAMGMLLVCTYLANSMSVTGASWATKLAGKWSFGATAFAFRNTARWGLQRGAQRWKSSRYANIPIAGRAIGNLLDRGAKSSFDLRGTKVAQNIFKAAHIDAGEVEKGGFAEIEKKRIEEREKYAKSLKQTQQDKDREAAAKETKRQRQRTYDADMSTLDAQHTAQLQPLETNVAQARARLNQARAAGNATAIHTEELSLNNALQDLAQLRQRQQEYRKGLENVHNAEIALLDKEIANTKTEQMRRYARGLRLGLSEDHWINRMVNPYRNTEAAHHIEEFANKSKEDRDRETLVTALQNAATRVGAPSGGGAAPAPAPTGGGHP